jgi:hypothetical protein
VPIGCTSKIKAADSSAGTHLAGALNRHIGNSDLCIHNLPCPAQLVGLDCARHKDHSHSAATRWGVACCDIGVHGIPHQAIHGVLVASKTPVTYRTAVAGEQLSSAQLNEGMYEMCTWAAYAARITSSVRAGDLDRMRSHTTAPQPLMMKCYSLECSCRLSLVPQGIPFPPRRSIMWPKDHPHSRMLLSTVTVLF